MTAQLLSERVDSTLVLTISNPEARNALHPDIYAASQEALELDRKSTRLNSSHLKLSRMPSSA